MLTVFYQAKVLKVEFNKLKKMVRKIIASKMASAGSGTMGYMQSDNGKKVMRLGLLIVAGVVVYYLVKGVVKRIPSREEVQAGSNELDVLNQNSETKQKITKQQAESFANVLHVSMDGYGTDENAIVNVFSKLKNNADYLAVSNAYDIREVSSGKLNPEPNYKGTMAGALHSELSSYYTAKINSMLRSKKITYSI
jgi:hypothetical protein